MTFSFNGGPGAITTYEIGKMLEPHGLTLNDVNIKIFPFPQYAEEGFTELCKAFGMRLSGTVRRQGEASVAP